MRSHSTRAALVPTKCDALTSPDELVKQVQAEGEKGNIGPLFKVDHRTLGVENTYARYEFICVVTQPLTGRPVASDTVFYCDCRFGRSPVGNDITKKCLATCSARLLEDSNIARLTGTVVAVNES